LLSTIKVRKCPRKGIEFDSVCLVVGFVEEESR
jgi:hypothetical protein